MSSCPARWLEPDGSVYYLSPDKNLLMLFIPFLFFLVCRAGPATNSETAEMLNGPWFTSEPPAWLEFTNQTGAVVSCVASGQPTPTVSWMAASELTAPSSAGLSDMVGLRRIVTTASHNATLIFPPFAATAYRPDVHSTTYRCRASSPSGTILSREMRLRAGMKN